MTSAQVAVLLGPPAVSQPPPASPLLPEPFRRLCHTGDSWLHPARLETVTFSADCRGCRHTGLAWPRAYRGASSPAVCLGETPAPLHGAGGRGVSGAWPGIVEMPGVWMQRGPWRCGVQGEGLGENLPAPCPSPSHITLKNVSCRQSLAGDSVWTILKFKNSKSIQASGTPQFCESYLQELSVNRTDESP